jgi:hypothetical protein
VTYPIQDAPGDVSGEAARPRSGSAAGDAKRRTGRATPDGVVEPQILHPAVVAAEELVAPIAREQHLDPVLVRRAGDVRRGDPRRIRARVVEVREPVVEPRSNLLLGDEDRAMLDAEIAREPCRGRCLVVGPTEGYGVRGQLGAAYVTNGQPRDGGRVDPPRQHQPERHVAHERRGNRLVEQAE